jgi:hypothetical protein
MSQVEIERMLANMGGGMCDAAPVGVKYFAMQR